MWTNQSRTEINMPAFPAQSVGPTSGVTGQVAGPSEFSTVGRTNEPFSARPAGRPSVNLRTAPKAVELQSLATARKEALRLAGALEEAVASDDLHQMAISGMDLRDALRKLWRLRHLRSDEWSSVVNFLQVVTSNVEFEKYTQDMAASVRCVIESHLQADADSDNVDAAVVLLKRAKLNPWKALAPEGDGAGF
jgi:hypothetical protein